MTKKKIFAFLTALSCMGAGSMTASADYMETNQSFIDQGDRTEIIDNMFGGVKLYTSSTDTRFLVVTDGTELTDADVKDLTDFKSIWEIEWTESAPLEYPKIQFEPGMRLYSISFDSKEHLAETARKFQLTHDFAKEIYFTRSHRYQGCTLGNALKFTLRDESTVLDPEDFPQVYGLKMGEVYDGSYDGFKKPTPQYWYGGFTDAVMEECLAENAEGSYQSYLFMKELADNILAEHGDLFVSVEPTMKSIDFGGSESLATQSIWDSAGDSNTDGAVDASDAADVLTIAAQNGTGAGIKATSANDVNADGNVDASDAAAVLCYAAAQGTGAEVTWLDILKK